MSDRPRVLELFCGIGGCAAALGTRADVAAALDVNRRALAVYTHNFPHPVLANDVTTLSLDAFARWPADLWWLSPPCQPHTRSGLQRDLEDPRAAGLLSLLRGLRWFSPAEILRLLGFPAEFALPLGMRSRHAWALVGSSLSIAAVRNVLQELPELSLQHLA